MNENFLLDTDAAVRLYNEYARDLPVIDYHNHLSPDEVLGDYRYENIAELWIKGDPYKHRAMRMCGMEEKYITGRASDFEKFQAWCAVFPKLIGNPLQHWSKMELLRVFDIDIPICRENAELLWTTLNKKLEQPEYSSKKILSKFNIEYSAPCMTFNSDISGFERDSITAPSLRGDDMRDITGEFIWMLGKNADIQINSPETLKVAISKRYDAFHKAGCRFFDYAVDDGFTYISDDGKNEERLKKLINGEKLLNEDALHINSELLRIGAQECAARGWVMQLHIGAMRYTSSRLRKEVGPAGGFAGIGTADVRSIARMLDDLESMDNGIPKTVLFTLNPAYNEALAVLCGSYSKDGAPALVQQGPAWWWCDHYSGICGVLESVSSFGILYEFIGMTTDSRSVLSFVRHEYFRRVLCAWLGRKIEEGVFEYDIASLGRLVERICYENAAKAAGRFIK